MCVRWVEHVFGGEGNMCSVGLDWEAAEMGMGRKPRLFFDPSYPAGSFAPAN